MSFDFANCTIKAAKEHIKGQIAADESNSPDGPVLTTLLTIYANQTADEQRSHATTNLNGIGFSGHDARFFSSIASVVTEWINTPPKFRRWPRPLSPKQFAAVKKSIGKYAEQFARQEIAKAKQAASALAA